MRPFDEPMTEAELKAFAADFDHLSPTYARNPYAIYQYMRNNCPMQWSDRHGGYWIPSRREDIIAVASDDVNFTTTKCPSIPKFDRRVIPIDMDPPECLEWRAFLNPVLSPAAVAACDPIIRETAKKLVDGFIGRGKADLTGELARPLTTIVTLRTAGMDDSQWERIGHIMRTGINGEATPEQYQENNIWLDGEMQRLIDEQKTKPRSGAISELLKARFKGRALTDEEIAGTIRLFLAGGIDTTQAVLSVTYYMLSHQPALKKRLIENPALRAVALEEFLRFGSPQQTLAREAVRDCVIGGQTIKAGQQVLLPWASGNWDESEFDRPGECVIDRAPNRHMAFGIGVHRCAGSNLARRMYMACLDEVLERIPDFEVEFDKVERGRNCGIVYSINKLPVTFRPRAA